MGGVDVWWSPSLDSGIQVQETVHLDWFLVIILNQGGQLASLKGNVGFLDLDEQAGQGVQETSPPMRITG